MLQEKPMNATFVRNTTGSITSTQPVQPADITQYIKTELRTNDKVLGYAVSLLPVFTYENLPPLLKEKVLVCYENINTEDTEWHESIYECWKNILIEHGFENAQLNFSGFCSQGDGASFTANVNLEVFLKKYRLGNIFRLALNATKIGLVKIEIYRNDDRYYHESTMSARSENHDNNNEKLNIQLDDLNDLILARAMLLAKELYSDLRTEYDYLTSPIGIEGTLIMNDYRFTSEGEIFA
jgi:hypothetical protein